MNEPLGDREVLCVSQFTLLAETSRGNRPSYLTAARPEFHEVVRRTDHRLLMFDHQ